MVGGVDDLLVPVAGDDPVGPDLSYDPDRGVIEACFESGFSEDGDTSDVNWADVINRICKQLERTKDIWLPVYMMRAGAISGRLNVVATGAEVLAGLLEAYWDTVHPQLDEYGLQGRITPCGSLARIPEFLRPLRKIVLVSHPRLGSYSAVDLERFEVNGDGESDFGMFRAAINDIDRSELVEVMEKLTGIKSALERVDRTFASQTGGDGPNLQPTYDTLDQIRRAVAAYAGAGEGTTDAETKVGEPDIGSPQDTASSTPRGVGRIDSREDVIRALDAIAEYYGRREPSSPIPVVLQRARQWVPLDFLAILEDIAPGGLDEATRVLVFKK